jgi:hypothetical protein
MALSGLAALCCVSCKEGLAELVNLSFQSQSGHDSGPRAIAVGLENDGAAVS